MEKVHNINFIGRQGQIELASSESVSIIYLQQIKPGPPNKGATSGRRNWRTDGRVGRGQEVKSSVSINEISHRKLPANKKASGWSLFAGASIPCLLTMHVHNKEQTSVWTFHGFPFTFPFPAPFHFPFPGPGTSTHLAGAIKVQQNVHRGSVWAGYLASEPRYFAQFNCRVVSGLG